MPIETDDSSLDFVNNGSDDTTQNDTTQQDAAPANNELSNAVKELSTNFRSFAESAKQPTQQQEPELTDEQKNELWAVYNPTKSRADFIQKFFRLNPEATPDQINEAKELFADLQKGLVKQSIVGARNLAQAEYAKMRQEFGPALEFVAQARAQATRDRFFSANESLKDPKFSKVIDATARTLADKTFASEAEYFKALADGAAETIKAVLPDFELSPKQKQQQQRSASTPRLPRTSVGGSGGAGNGGGDTDKGGSSDDDSSSLSW